MLTLTLRSARDGSFLARIVDQQGNVFVLDFGDRRVIDDATQRIHNGFTLFRGGKLIRAAPREPDLLLMLADYYAGEGMLISLEEPLWPQRESTLEDRFSHRDGDPPSVDALELMGDFEQDAQEMPTDIWTREDAERVRQLIGENRERGVRTTWSPGVSDDEVSDEQSQDLPTEIAPAESALPEDILGEDDDLTEVVRRTEPLRGDGGAEDDG